MNPAAFQATFSDWRLVKGRKVVQIIFEVPLEAAGQAYDVLGGMPDPGKSIWCAVARLNGKEGDAPERSQARRSQNETTPAPVDEPGRARKRFEELSPAQQAGIWCNEPAFWKFLEERHPVAWAQFDLGVGYDREAVAASVVRHLCGVNSRASIKSDSKSWQRIVNSYPVWKSHPELVA